MSLKKNNIPQLTNFKLIIGLGNPGKLYTNTPHNCGFIFIDKLKITLEYQFNEINKKEYSLVSYPSLNLQLLKPLTYMNDSGKVLSRLLKYNSYKAEEVLIVHDDLDLNLGKYKLQFNKFPKTHNGILSIHKETGKTKFWYLRLGIETRDTEDKTFLSGKDYVLKNFSKNQQEILEKTIKKIIQEMTDKI